MLVPAVFLSLVLLLTCSPLAAQSPTEAVDSVVLSDTAGVVSRVHLRNAGAMPMPVELAVTLSGGKTLRIRLPAEVWYQGSTYAAVVPGDVTGVRVDARSP